MRTGDYERALAINLHRTQGMAFVPDRGDYVLYYRLDRSLVPTWVDEANNELEAWTQERCSEAIAYLESSAAEDRDVGNEPVVLSALMAGIAGRSPAAGQKSPGPTRTRRADVDN